MNKTVGKFLEFNGKTIFFVAVDGQYWIAVKPICSILEVNYNRQWGNIKSDPVIRGVFKLQYFKAADERMRRMSCLSEFNFYYWLLQMRSYKKEIRPIQYELFETIYKQLNSSKKTRSVIGERIEFAQSAKQQNQVNARLRNLDGEVLQEERNLFT